MVRNVGVTETLVEVLPGWAREVFVALAMLGDWLLVVAVLGLLYLTDVTRNLRADVGADQPLCSDRTAFVIAVVFGGIAFTLLVKTLFGAPRPPAELHAVSPSEDGFPSGHTMVAAIFWGALAWWVAGGPRRLRIAAVAVVVSIVGLSRLALGVHFLGDVLASVVFAAGYLAAAAWLTKGRPIYAFGLAFALALLATLASGGETRAMLALVGTAVAPLGWRLVELRTVRHSLGRLVPRAD